MGKALFPYGLSFSRPSSPHLISFCMSIDLFHPLSPFCLAASVSLHRCIRLTASASLYLGISAMHHTLFVPVLPALCLPDPICPHGRSADGIPLDRLALSCLADRLPRGYLPPTGYRTRQISVCSPDTAPRWRPHLRRRQLLSGPVSSAWSVRRLRQRSRERRSRSPPQPGCSRPPSPPTR